jgi:putative transcriptional regulator
VENYFYKNLKFLRLSNGMTQADLAKRLKKDYTTIGKWEKRERTPKLEEVIRIAEVFDVPLSEIITEDLTNPKKEK